MFFLHFGTQSRSQNQNMTKSAILTLGTIIIFSISILAQTNSRPWTEWSKKDADKILNDSAWGQTQTVGSNQPTSTSAITKTEGAGREDVGRSGESGETMAGPKPINYRVRFLTAKPVREAFARIVTISQPSAGKDLTDQLQSFIDRDFGNYLVVVMSVDSDDQRAAAMSMGALGKITKDILKDKVYLERKDGKRLELLDYKPPINDGMGAKFIFERSLDGQPFLDNNSDSVKFSLELSGKMKVNVKFRISAMMYSGKLEY